MSSSEAITVMREGLVLAARIAAPILIISMLVGLIISVFQAATQIHEQTITFVPKLVLIVLILFAAGPWMLESMLDFTKYIFLLMEG